MARAGVASTVSVEPTGEDCHERAANAFAKRVRELSIAGLERLYVFGSTARGEAEGLASDVDVLAIAVESERDRVEDRLRNVGYDVMLEYGPVVEVHVLGRTEFDEKRERGDPFLSRVLAEGKRYV